MKNIRNKKLQQLCEQKLNLKDVILNFDDGLVYIYSDDDNTSNILAKADTSIIAGQGGAIKSFLNYSIDDWFNIIKDWYNNNLDINFDKKSSWIRIISAKTKKTSPKVKKIVKKPTKTTKKTKNTSRRFKIKPNKVLKKKPNKDIKPNKKPYTSRNKPVSKRFKIRTKGIYPLQDVSLPVFEDLLNQGYDTATFVAHPNACSYCKKRNGITWNLKDFISNLQYNAPIFEKASHVNSRSNIKVSDSKGKLEDVYVNYNGDIS